MVKIAIITAGGAGMFCGSCMQDNTLARTLRLAGEDAVLVPTYTPIRVDEENASIDEVFLGGVNVYLDSTVPGWKRLPRWMTSWLNRPSIISLLTRFGSSTEASKLGSLTLDMLRGSAGPQRREIEEFVDYLCDDLKPDVVIFSNALLSGVVPTLRPRYEGRILCLLQGDDIFLEGLTPRWKQPVLQQLTENGRQFDGFLAHSKYYAHFMASYLTLPIEKIRKIPLSIDTSTATSDSMSLLPSEEEKQPQNIFRIGYFARICPEKGVQNLLSAAKVLLPGNSNVRIPIAGYLPGQHRAWFDRLLADVQQVAPGQIEYLGSPAGRDEKFDVIRSFDVLCVPTEYQEPKGIYVLESALHNVPSVLPRHGAFPELIQQLGCGTLYDPLDEKGLETALQQCIDESTKNRVSLADKVCSLFGMESTAQTLRDVIHSF